MGGNCKAADVGGFVEDRAAERREEIQDEAFDDHDLHNLYCPYCGVQGCSEQDRYCSSCGEKLTHTFK